MIKKEEKIMKREKGQKGIITRREFIKTASVGAGATALAGFSSAEAKEAGLPEKWDKETDVVIVGCGGAGTTAAITAADAGARVIIVEKAPEGGGNSRIGGGQFSYSTSEKKDNAAKYLFAACNGTTPMDVCQAWADEMVHNGEWLKKMGVSYNTPSVLNGGDYKGLPGSDGIGTGMMNALGWYKIIEKNIKDRGIEIMFNSPATELVQHPITKEILGVKVSSDGRDRYIKARKGVVLCSGGFEFNEDMIKNYLRPSTIKFTGWVYNTGDGIKMAQAVGADLWHMNMIASALYTIVTPESKMGWIYPEPKGSNFILVSKYGQRFMKEGDWFPHRSIMGYSLWDFRGNRKDTEYPCCPHYMIFDETTRLAGGIGSGMGGMGITATPTWLGGLASSWEESGSDMALMTGGGTGGRSGGASGGEGGGGPSDMPGMMPGGIQGGASGGASAGGVPSDMPSGGRSGSSGGGRTGTGKWSSDNSAEIAKGWIKKADTIDGLAKLIGGEMTPEALTATVTRWNGFCDAGVDSDFGRSNARGGMNPRNLEKIEKPPFYAIEIWPGGFSTCGGPRKNAEGQVMGVDGKPIKRLYEAGSLGHTCGQVYSMSGANYCEVFVWGRISGRSVAALKSWS